MRNRRKLVGHLRKLGVSMAQFVAASRSLRRRRGHSDEKVLRADLAAVQEQARAAEDRAQKAHDQLRAAIDALPEGIVFLDQDGRYILWNESYAKIYKRSADLFRPGARLADTLRVGVGR